MSITVGGRTIETDEEGYLLNPDDWSEEVAELLPFESPTKKDGKLADEHWGLIEYFRLFYKENQAHPTMHELVMTLGKHHGEHFHDHKAYEKFLYQLFPRGPVPELCKLAGLPKPKDEYEG
jgi:TusE/DsrC/DsvC family sulfur relay protein